jgi:hypothetical protein
VLGARFHADYLALCIAKTNVLHFLNMFFRCDLSA